MNGHEKDDVSVRWLALSGAGLVAMMVVSVLIVGALLGRWNRTNPDKTPAGRAPALPARVLDWRDPPAARRQIESQSRQRLEGYAWIDKERGVVRIPIERAMRLLAQGPATQETQP